MDQKHICITTQTPHLAKKGAHKFRNTGNIPPKTSKCSSSIITVPKKKEPFTHEAMCSMVEDFRRVNEQLEYWSCLSMRIDRILSKLYEATLYCTLGVRSGYYNITVAEDSHKYTTFTTE